jgi:hypothetical protein
MIYLFNSGFRNLYRRNVLNTLFLPSGLRNEYRYHFEGESPNVDASFAREVIRRPAGTPVTVVFIDRYCPGGYRYYPIRTGTLLSARLSASQIFFEAELDELIWPLAPEATSIRLFEALRTRQIPQLGITPENTHDGYYAIEVPAEAGGLDLAHFYRGDAAWVRATEDLSQTAALSSSETAEIVFGRLLLTDDVALRRGRVILTRGNEGRMRFQYVFPPNRQRHTDTITATAVVAGGVEVITGERFYIDAHMNDVPIHVAVKRHADETSSSLRFSFASSQSKALMAPDAASISISIKEPAVFWLLASVGILLFALSGTVAGIDTSKARSISEALAQVTPLRLIASLVQSATLLFLIRLVGKKFL